MATWALPDPVAYLQASAQKVHTPPTRAKVTASGPNWQQLDSASNNSAAELAAAAAAAATSGGASWQVAQRQQQQQQEQRSLVAAGKGGPATPSAQDTATATPVQVGLRPRKSACEQEQLEGKVWGRLNLVWLSYVGSWASNLPPACHALVPSAPAPFAAAAPADQDTALVPLAHVL